MQDAAEIPAGVKKLVFPWQQDADNSMQGNCAVGNLKNFLLTSLNAGRGVHVETLLTVTGAMAGFAAQQAAFEEKKKQGQQQIKMVFKLSELAQFAQEDLISVHCDDGHVYFFGDALNAYLLPQKGGSEFTLWSICAGAALAAGIKVADLPNVGSIFSHVAGMVGKADYGKLRPIPRHEAHMTPRQSLLKYWAHVHAILIQTKPFGANGPELPPLAAKYWPAVVATVAQSFITMSKDALSPAISLLILMESAVLMSKLDPVAIPNPKQPFKIN